MGAYQKAYIYPCKDDSPMTSRGMAVQFNPSEITIEEAVRSSTTEGKEGSQGSILKRVKGHEIGRQWPFTDSYGQKEHNELTLSATLFFNTLENINQENCGDVRDYIKPLYPYTNRITSQNKGNSGKIEKICFYWGSIVVVGILTKMSVHYTMFAPSGRPVRAEVSISIVGDYYGEQLIRDNKTPGEGEWFAYGSMKDEIKSFQDPGNWRREADGGNPRSKLPRNG